MKKLISGLFLSTLISFSASAIEDLGCTFMLCIASPVGYQAGGKTCVDAVEEVFDRLARGKGLPQCKGSGIPMSLGYYRDVERVYCNEDETLGQEVRKVRQKHGDRYITSYYYKPLCGAEGYDAFGQKELEIKNVNVIPYTTYVKFDLNLGWLEIEPEVIQAIKDSGVTVPPLDEEQIILHPITHIRYRNIPECASWKKKSSIYRSACNISGLPTLKTSSSSSSPSDGAVSVNIVNGIRLEERMQLINDNLKIK